MQTKENLLESKDAQLYQIEEKKLLKQKEKEREKQWLLAMEKYKLEKVSLLSEENWYKICLYLQESQQFYENKLRKCIVDSSQATNQDLDAELKTKLSLEDAASKEYHAKEWVEISVLIFEKYL